jgi:hypothetical protein
MLTFVGCSVKFEEEVIDGGLVGHADTGCNKGRCDGHVDVRNSLGDAYLF